MELVLPQLNVQIKEVQQVVIVLLGKCIRIQIEMSMLENNIANTEIHALLSCKWGNSEEQSWKNSAFFRGCTSKRRCILIQYQILLQDSTEIF